MALQMHGKRSKLLSNVTTTFVAIFALLLQPVVALNLPAAFAAGEIIVTAENLQGWAKIGNVEPQFVAEVSTVGSGALKFSTPGGADYVQLDRELISQPLAKDINVSYDTRALGGPVAHAAPAYMLAIDRDGGQSNDADYFWAYYEPADNNSEGKDYSSWNTWNITSSSKFWYHDYNKPAEAVNHTPLDNLLGTYPNATVVGVTLNMGTGNDGWSALVDNVRTPDATYDFEPKVVTNPTATIVTPSEGGIVATKPYGNTLRLTGSFTDDKAVNYLQLELVDAAGNLETVYSMHYNNSNLKADGTFDIKMPVPPNLEDGNYRLYYTGTDFEGGSTTRLERKFVIDNTAPISSITNIKEGDLVGLNSEGKLVVTGNFSDNLSGANYIQTQLVYKGNDKGVVTKHGEIQNGIFAEYDVANLVDGSEYYIAFTATDVAGNVSERKIINFTLDRTLPDQVQNLKLSGSNGPIANSTTQSYAVTANWGSVAGAQKYEYCYWNDIATSVYREANCYTTYPTPTATSQSGVLNQGEGMHHFKVRAIDAAGNKGYWSTTYNVVYLENDAKVNGENFNTYNGPDYKGISVGFNIENFKNVTDVKIGLYRENEDTPFVTNSGTQKLLDLINVDGAKQLSTPFVISPAGYADEYWSFGPHAWTKNDRPVRAEVIVSGTNNADQTVSKPRNMAPMTEPDGVTFESIAPAVAETDNPVLPGAPATTNPIGATTSAGGSTNSDTIDEDAVVAGRASVFQSGDLAFLAPGENANRSEVLGSKDSQKKGEVTAKAASSEVLGDSDSDGCFKILGLCWYWWIPIVAAVAAIIWFIKKIRDENDSMDGNSRKLS